jgi:hypothetical protein
MKKTFYTIALLTLAGAVQAASSTKVSDLEAKIIALKRAQLEATLYPITIKEGTSVADIGRIFFNWHGKEKVVIYVHDTARKQRALKLSTDAVRVVAVDCTLGRVLHQIEGHRTSSPHAVASVALPHGRADMYESRVNNSDKRFYSTSYEKPFAVLIDEHGTVVKIMHESITQEAIVKAFGIQS